MSISSRIKISTEKLYQVLEPIVVPSDDPRASFTNWGRTFSCKPLAIFEPVDEQQCELVLELARREGKVVRAAGVGHSPSDLACTNGFMLRTTKLNRVLEVNVEKSYVIVQGGITLNKLHEALGKYNLAMSNLGSISEQTLAGVVTTATHGSGIEYKVLSSYVLSLTLLLADGSRVTCSRTENPELFLATLSGLGSTGVILTIKMEVEPAYRLKEQQESVPFEYFASNMERMVNSAEHVRFWWYPTMDTVRCSYSSRTAEPRNPAGNWWWHSFIGYHVVQFLLFLGRYFQFVNPWIANLACWLVSEKSVGVDDSHRIFNVDCRYPQHTTEWAVPLKNSQACLREFRDWLNQEFADPHGVRPHFPVEIRFSASDDIWLSPSNGQQTCWIGIVQYKPYGFNVPYRRLFTGFENIVSKYQGRPHWAKAHKLRPDDLRKMYPRFDDFVRVLESVDPQGILRNEYVQRHIMGRPIDGRVFKPRKA
ncbi:L-gulonolactone/D-arabinono-1,4-lactone oxidase [Coprinopsis marcescibilis]|uniref:D-arabinono-1,4-lactone oxidase n=1 Tax=Coprinopsis marcescibilis TaxID=230819 RepID=A0A5C3L7T8_COPMA|nr:L-gulonolactone/D-arabinono-1,4-lactone oxidase [Coprinopsis marcescibilis]